MKQSKTASPTVGEHRRRRPVISLCAMHDRPLADAALAPLNTTLRMSANRTSDLPQLGLPCWLQRWASTAGRKHELETRSHSVLIVAFGLIRSIPMLHTTMQSLETYAPEGARLTVRAFCRASEVAAVHTRLNRTTLPLQSIALFDLRAHATSSPTLHHAPVPHPCAGAPINTRLLHQNYLEAAQLLLHLHDWSADTVVVWRIDTELVSPIESGALMPWRHPRRVYVPYLQSGGFLNDRFVLGHPYPIKLLLQAREALVASRCTYGEPALMHLIQTLNLTVAFTRTRVVRRRSDLAVPEVDATAVLGEDRARPWMKNINSLSRECVCSQRSCENFRPSEQPFCRVVGFRIDAWGDGRSALQERRLRPSTPSRRPVSNRTTTQEGAHLGLPDETALIFGVHGNVQHACPYYRAWESRCQWSVPLSPAAPLPRRGPRVGRLLILGDSLDAQLFAAVACNLYEHRGPDIQLEFEATWENGIAALKKRCDSLNRCHYTSATLRVHSGDQAHVPFRTMHLCQGIRAECLRKLNFDPATDVVATGLDALHGASHGARGMFVRGVMNATLAAIEARKDARRVLDLVPNQRLIWREATAQHFPALGGHWLHGFMLRSNIEQLDQRCAHRPLAEMIRHAHWNPAAEPLVRAAGVPVLRTWMASAKAWYAHTDHGDCTHFCQPGLLDGWAAQLLEMVSALVARRRIQDR